MFNLVKFTEFKLKKALIRGILDLLYFLNLSYISRSDVDAVLPSDSFS